MFDNIKIGANIPTSSSKNIGNTYNNDIGLSITLPNVKNYEEFKYALQHDKNFEEMVRAMTTDRLFKKSQLNKYKH